MALLVVRCSSVVSLLLRLSCLVASSSTFMHPRSPSCRSRIPRCRAQARCFSTNCIAPATERPKVCERSRVSYATVVGAAKTYYNIAALPLMRPLIRFEKHTAYERRERRARRCKRNPSVHLPSQQSEQLTPNNLPRLRNDLGIDERLQEPSQLLPLDIHHPLKVL